MTRSFFDGGRRVWRGAVFSGLVLCTLAGTACSMDSLVGKEELPSTLVDPAEAKTPNGAYGNYISALALLRNAVGNGDVAYVNTTGVLVDEGATPTQDPSGNFYTGASLDTRIIPEGGTSGVGYTYYGTYTALQQVRGQANQAQLLLRDYYPAPANRPLMAYMLAAKGYAEVMLAEAYCSGIPLSTLDYDGDYTLKAGSTTAQVLEHAITQFDSAITLADDSTTILNLARVGKGRALLQLGRYADAATAVTNVPDDYRYDFRYSVTAKVCGLWDCSLEWMRHVNPVVDREGGNGMPFISEHDDRLPPIIDVPEHGYTDVPDFPKDHTIRLASGVEAQLIRAEAELKAGDANWLTRLNALRTTCIDAATCASPAPAGSGGVAGLAPLTDPGSDTARVSLLFRERAYWMFLTGHRMGDLRRLVRQYGRDQINVFPSGQYNTDFQYGDAVNFPVPRDEMKLNPLYIGCYDRNA